jgi:hypothetical protein
MSGGIVTSLTPYHAKCYAYELTRRCPPDSEDRLAGALVDAQGDLNPHQIDAALFAFRSPLSRGVLLADEVGLGKTIEAGLVLAQRWAERKRRLLADASDSVHDYRSEPYDKSKIGQMLFGGFSTCLYGVQKFHSDTERRFAVILERDARRWFRPAKGQFQIDYRLGIRDHPYVPDFVAERDDELLMVETKARGDMGSAEVLAKKEAAITWCRHASKHAATYGGKPWRYVLVAHDEVAENRTLGSFR